MLFCKTTLFMVLRLAHHLHASAVSKEVIEQQLGSRCPLVLDAASNRHDPEHKTQKPLCLFTSASCASPPLQAIISAS